MNYKSFNDILVSLPSNIPIYIGGHIRPDQDSVCSCVALAEYLKMLGKNASVLLNKSEFDVISWLEDFSLLVDTIKDTKYNFIALDVNEKCRLGCFEFCFDKATTTINIDHHQNNKYEAMYTLSKPNISSTCEIVFNIINSNDNKYLTSKICSCLYTGMMADTNCFTRRLSSKTLSIAQKLVNKGVDYKNIINNVFFKRSLYEFKALAKLINEIKHDGIHYVVVDQQLEEFKKLSYNSIVKNIAEDLRKIEDIDIFLILIKNNNTIISKVMSNKSENANQIATIFGGGGHKKEAGFTIENITVDEIIQKTKSFLKM